MSDEQLTNHLLTILLLELGGKQFSNFFCILFQVPNKLVSRHCTGEGFPCGGDTWNVGRQRPTNLAIMLLIST